MLASKSLVGSQMMMVNLLLLSHLSLSLSLFVIVEISTDKTDQISASIFLIHKRPHSSSAMWWYASCRVVNLSAGPVECQ